MRTRLSRRRSFRVRNQWNPARWPEPDAGGNAGPCLMPTGLGHEYQVEVVLEGTVDPASGMIMNLIDVDRALANTLAPLENRRLEDSLPYFRAHAPSTANVATYLFTELARAFADGPARLAKLRVFESADAWVDLWA